MVSFLLIRGDVEIMNSKESKIRFAFMELL